MNTPTSKVWVSPLTNPLPWLNVLQFCSDTVYLGIAPNHAGEGLSPQDFPLPQTPIIKELPPRHRRSRLATNQHSHNCLLR